VTTWVSVGRPADIPPTRCAVFSVGDHDVAVCNVAGELYAIDDLCTHDNGPLGQGELDEAEIECPRHWAKFDVRTGRATQLPAFLPVETHDVRVADDTVQVGLEHR